MPITEQLMGIGSWSIQLEKNTPPSILTKLDLATAGFGQIVVLPLRVNSEVYSYTQMRSMALYTGVYRQRDGLQISGGGLALLLGDEDNKGDIIVSPISNAGTTLSVWVAALLPSNGISSGTITNTGLNNLAGTYQYVSRRSVLDLLCQTAGAQWDISPNMVLSAAAPSILFPNYANPVAIATRKGSGRELGRSQVGIVPVELSNVTDLQDYSTKIYQIGRENGFVVNAATAGSVPFHIPGGAAIKMERVVDGPSTSVADSANLAVNLAAQYSTLRQQATLSTSEYLLSSKVGVGDGLGVYDPESGLYDLTNQFQYEGISIWPRKLQVTGITWPLVGNKNSGMGVYFITPAATPEVVDLTDFVVWEDPDQSPSQIEVGPVTTTLGPVSPSLAPTGDVTMRTLNSWTLFPMSVTTWTMGNGPANMWYTIEGKKFRCHLFIQAGTTSSWGVGVVPTFSMPVQVARDYNMSGDWLVIRNAGPQYMGRWLARRGGGGTSTLELYYQSGTNASAAQWTATAGGFGAWAIGDAIYGEFDAEIE